MEKSEYKVLFQLSEEELNKWGEEGYEIDRIIPPPPSGNWDPPELRCRDMILILKRRKP